MSRKKRKYINLWFTFVLVVFFSTLLSTVLLSLIAAFFLHFGLFIHLKENPLVPIIMLLFISTCIGTVFSMISAKVIINPIKRFSHGLNQVAKGDFNVSLEENQKIYEIDVMAKNFNKMVIELSSIETLRNDFIANVSHEFKTPLSTIEGYVTLLQSEDLSPQQKQNYIDIIMSSTRQLSTLTSNILKISKLEHQEQLLDKNWFSLDEQIRQALLFLESKWTKKEINLDLELATISFYGNEELMIQVFINLIDNAIKFTSKGGQIQIVAYQTSNEVTVSITDNGIGISKEGILHLFEKFYQSDKARLSEGNGLGLTLVKHIVDLSGGTIDVHSELGVGTTFTLTFPTS